MNSAVINILEILNTARSLNSAGFSAGYSFNETSGEEFFNDLLENENTLAPIFSGIIIIETSSEDGDFVVIDGLQRITTLCLLLCALCECYKGTTANNEESRHKIFARYLTNRDDIKLQLRGKEQEIYRKIVFSQKLSENEKKHNLYQTYKSFFVQIQSKRITATKLFKIISRIQFMVVFTDKNKVSARELYQSLNNKKDDLSQVNLITSFISQNCVESGQFWQNTIENYKKNDLANLFNKFIRDFLAIQNNGKVSSEQALYKNFKIYYHNISKFQTTRQIVENIDKYSRFYLQIIQSNFEDYEIQKQITMINENNGQDSYPYLMEVLDDLENSHIGKEIFIEILTMISTFVISRNEDASGSTTMNFATLSVELNKMLAQKEYNQPILEENKITINEMNHLSTFEV